MLNSPEAVRLLKTAEKCAIEADICDKMFLSFGTMLGAIRPTKRKDKTYRLGFIPHDTDMDIGFLPILKEEKDRFYECCKKAGIVEWENPDARMARLKPTKELVWFKIHIGDSKSCIWFFCDWNGFMWHSKGDKWLFGSKFSEKEYPRRNDAKAMMLGAPVEYFNELIRIDFEGERFNIPLKAGSLCDFWYPGWDQERKGGASAKDKVGVIYDWNDKSTWNLI